MKRSQAVEQLGLERESSAFRQVEAVAKWAHDVEAERADAGVEVGLGVEGVAVEVFESVLLLPLGAHPWEW